MSQVSLKFGGTTYEVKCQGVTIGYKPIVNSKPNVNGDVPSEVQAQGMENPIYNLTGVLLTEESGTLTKEALISMIKNKYDGTNPVVLNINYGIDNGRYWVGGDGTSQDINVVIQNVSVSIPTQDAYDNSVDGRIYLPTITITLQETS